MASTSTPLQPAPYVLPLPLSVDTRCLLTPSHSLWGDCRQSRPPYRELLCPLKGGTADVLTGVCTYRTLPSPSGRAKPVCFSFSTPLRKPFTILRQFLVLLHSLPLPSIPRHCLLAYLGSCASHFIGLLSLPSLHIISKLSPRNSHLLACSVNKHPPSLLGQPQLVQPSRSQHLIPSHPSRWTVPHDWPGHVPSLSSLCLCL